MTGPRRVLSLGLGFAVCFLAAAAAADEPSRVARARELPDRRPIPSDDLTFRPTVIVRKGLAQGSGTVIASVDGEALVLTAAHVVKDAGALVVELHRYNLALDRAEAPGRWPKRWPGKVVATDPSADIAVVRVDDLPALPYVARLAPADADPERGEIVLSVGIDKGTHLSSWRSRVSDMARLALDENHAARPFVITVQPPERGRSGGGLFLERGMLVGVCIGRAEMIKGRTSGVFSSAANVRRLLLDHGLDDALERSEARRAALAPGTVLTPTRARPEKPPR